MFIAKFKGFLLHLYPELSRFPIFQKITSEVIPVISPKIRKFFRYGLPIITLIFVLVLGINIGNFFSSLLKPSVSAPTPVPVITPVPTSTYRSTFIPLSRSVMDFNPQLPDPIPPVFDEKISLEVLTE